MTRQYSSFLLRFWSVNDLESANEAASHPLVLQIQHLQTGATWRLNTLEELNNLLTTTLTEDGLRDLKALTLTDTEAQ